MTFSWKLSVNIFSVNCLFHASMAIEFFEIWHFGRFRLLWRVYFKFFTAFASLYLFGFRKSILEIFWLFWKRLDVQDGGLMADVWRHTSAISPPSWRYIEGSGQELFAPPPPHPWFRVKGARFFHDFEKPNYIPRKTNHSGMWWSKEEYSNIDN